MSTAVFRRDNVMNLIGGNITTVLETLIAERMSGDVNATNPSPLPTVKLVVVGMTKFVILTTCDELMLGAETLGGKSGAVGIFTGFEELIGHRKPPKKRDEHEPKNRNEPLSLILFLLLFYTLFLKLKKSYNKLKFSVLWFKP